MEDDPKRHQARVPVLYMLLPVVHVLAVIAFAKLRDHQLSLPDPYNNPYTTWSTLCLCLAGALWLIGCIWTAVRIKRQRRLSWIVGIWLTLATYKALALLLAMLLFFFPA